MTLATEIRRVNGQMSRMLWRDSYAAEVPLRLHSHGVGEGHGLGGPDLAPQFIAYLRDAGVCFCEPREIDGYAVFRHSCDRRYEKSPSHGSVKGEKFHTRRIKRALRQLRAICADEWEVVFPMLGRGQSWSQMTEYVNAGRLARGLEPHSQADFVVLALSGFSKTAESY